MLVAHNDILKKSMIKPGFFKKPGFIGFFQDFGFFANPAHSAHLRPHSAHLRPHSAHLRGLF